MTTHCCDCGGPLARGQTSRAAMGTNRRRCLICLTALRLAAVDLRQHRPHAPRPVVECICGCGRVGALMARGMVGVCYQRWYLARRAVRHSPENPKTAKSSD